MASRIRAFGVQPLSQFLSSPQRSLTRESSANAERQACPDIGLVSLFKRADNL